MVKKLNNEQIERWWDDIREVALLTLPRRPVDTEVWLHNLMVKLLTDVAQCWVGVEDNNIKVMVLTMFIEDAIYDEKHLLVYYIYGVQFLSEQMYKDIIETLVTYAKDTKCSHIVAYSNIDRIVSVCRDKLNADVSTHYMKWRL